jgi:hypothetical protein
MRSKTVSEVLPKSFVFGGGVSLSMDGPRVSLGHFGAEYGSASCSVEGLRSDVYVEIEHPPYRELRTMNGYKTARWRIALGRSDERLDAKIALLSSPASFGLSLVQGYFVEPLLEMAFTQKGAVLAPAAGFVSEGGACLLAGASRSGKSSLMVRALGAGVPILGDDQVIVTSRGTVFTFPRRLRVYPDIRATASKAYGGFATRLRRTLRGLQALSRFTAGWVAPPVRVQPAAVGPEPAKDELPLVGLYLIERDEHTDEARRSRLAIPVLEDEMLTLLDRQRERLIPLLATDVGWSDLLQRVREREREILRQALQGIDAEKLVVPAHWEAVRAIDHLQHEIGLPV